MRVAGVDGTKGGWVAVLLDDGHFAEAQLIGEVRSRFRELADAKWVAIDVPIGFGPRRADTEARSRVGGSSVFAIPERDRFDGVFGPGRGISAQAFAIGERIRWVTDEIASRETRFREVHPEVCFWAMNVEQRLRHRKKTAGGAFERLELLRRHGIEIDAARLGDAARVPLDDLVDAAACAWSAQRLGTRDARTGTCAAKSFPEPPEHIEGHDVAIWY